jgi:hypothetical protein
MSKRETEREREMNGINNMLETIYKHQKQQQ